MSNNLFAVVLTEGEEKGANMLRTAYPKAYSIAPNIFLVADDTLTVEVAKAAALTREQEAEGVRGIVFRLNGSYTGYTRRSVWEWLEDAEGLG